jgi:hypothetical protein
MKTYIRVQMDSEGAGLSEVAELLEDLGFKPVQGEYDFEYNWDKHASVKDSLWFADRIQMALKGMNVWFRIETTD